MPWTETIMRNGRQFSNIALIRQIESDLVSLTITSNSDPSRVDFASQSTLIVNDKPAIVTTLWIFNEICESVIELGPQMGGGVLRLSWTLKQEGDEMVANGGGEWNGASIEPFNTLMSKADTCDNVEKNDANEFVLADGTKAVFGEVDEHMARVLATFAEMAQGSPEFDPKSRDMCVAGCTAGAAACALACAALAGPAFGFCGKGCVVAQSACIAGCA